MNNPVEKLANARKTLEEIQQELHSFLADNKSRARGQANLRAYEIAAMLGPARRYYSQAGQDLIIDRVLKQKRDGVFADIGGFDGVTGSNTLFFEQFRGWSGIVVEPAPTKLREAEQVRRCPCYGYAVAGDEGTAEFLEVTKGYIQMSGFLDSYEPDLLTRVRANPAHEEVIHTLEKKLLNDILAEAKLDEIDFLSLDVEGGEMGILESFDFDAVHVDFWSIENNTQSPELPKLMADKGFDLIEFAGVDDIFRNRNSK